MFLKNFKKQNKKIFVENTFSLEGRRHECSFFYSRLVSEFANNYNVSSDEKYFVGQFDCSVNKHFVFGTGLFKLRTFLSKLDNFWSTVLFCDRS